MYGLLRAATRFANKAKIERYAAREHERVATDELNLRRWERRVYSQNREDGIIEEIFARIGTVSKTFLEIGVEVGKECNTRLLMGRGWTGTWIEGSAEFAAQARNTFGHAVDVVNAFVTRDNVLGLLPDRELDLLSIDIDGIDYWLWQQIPAARARVVIVEYNASHPPPRRWVMPYNADHVWHRDNVFGASLASLEALAKEKGYTLVACDSGGVNSFYVRNDVLAAHAERFAHIDGGAQYHYCAPKWNETFFGHPPAWRARRIARSNGPL
jgi:hypothetical protein